MKLKDMFRDMADDLAASPWLMSRTILIAYRYGNWVFYSVKNPIMRFPLWWIYKLIYFPLSVLSGSDIPAKTIIGSGVRLEHGGQGVMIHADVVIGKSARIFHQVTIGRNDPPRPNEYGCPKVGNNVLIGAGAKIIGSISVGDNAKIGANAVVVSDVSPNTTVIGIPAKTT